MTDKKMIEIPEEALMDAAGGGTTISADGKRWLVITGITKKCGKFVEGANDWPIIAIPGTCAECKYLKNKKGHQVCSHPDNVTE